VKIKIKHRIVKGFTLIVLLSSLTAVNEVYSLNLPDTEKTSTSAAEKKIFTFSDQNEITLKSISRGKTYDGKDAVIITYDFKNLSQSPVAPFSSVGIKVYQNGKELQTGFSPDVKDNTMKPAEKDSEIKDCSAIFMGDEKNGDLTIEIYPLFSSQTGKETFEVSYPLK